MSKIDYFVRYGHKFFLIFDMNFTFITNFNKIPYEYYLKQPKSILEWRLIENIARNPKLLKAFHRTLSHPLFPKYSHTDQDGEI